MNSLNPGLEEWKREMLVHKFAVEEVNTKL